LPTEPDLPKIFAKNLLAILLPLPADLNYLVSLDVDSHEKAS
jgi:hypothetical protein